MPATPSKSSSSRSNSNDDGTTTNTTLATYRALQDTLRAQPSHLFSSEQPSASSEEAPSSHKSARQQDEEEDKSLDIPIGPEEREASAKPQPQLQQQHDDETSKARRVSEPLLFAADEKESSHDDGDFSLKSKKSEPVEDRALPLVGPLDTHTPLQPSLLPHNTSNISKNEDKQGEDTSVSATYSDAEVVVQDVHSTVVAEERNEVQDSEYVTSPLATTQNAAEVAAANTQQQNNEEEEGNEHTLMGSDASPAPRPPHNEEAVQTQQPTTTTIALAIYKDNDNVAVMDLPSRYRNSNESHVSTSSSSTAASQVDNNNNNSFNSRGSVERARINSTFVPSQVPPPLLPSQLVQANDEDLSIGRHDKVNEAQIRHITQPLPAILRVPVLTSYESVEGKSGSNVSRSKSSHTAGNKAKENNKPNHESPRERSTSDNTNTVTVSRTQVEALHATEAALSQSRSGPLRRSSSNAQSETQVLRTSSQRSWRPRWLPRWLGKRNNTRPTTQQQQHSSLHQSSHTDQTVLLQVAAQEENEGIGHVNALPAMHAEDSVPSASVSDAVLRSNDNNNNTVSVNGASSSRRRSKRQRHRGSASKDRHSVYKKHDEEGEEQPLPHLTSIEEETASAVNQSSNEANKRSSLIHVPRHIQAGSHHHNHHSTYHHLTSDALETALALNATNTIVNIDTNGEGEGQTRNTRLTTRRRRNRHRRRSWSTSTRTPPSQLATLKEDTTRPIEEATALVPTRTSLGRTRERQRKRASHTNKNNNKNSITNGTGEGVASAEVKRGSTSDSSAYEYYYPTHSDSATSSAATSSSASSSYYTSYSTSTSSYSSRSSLLTASMRRDTMCESTGMGPLEHFKAFDEGNSSALTLNTSVSAMTTTTNMNNNVTQPSHSLPAGEGEEEDKSVKQGTNEPNASATAIVVHVPEMQKSGDEQHDAIITTNDGAIVFHREADSTLLPVAAASSSAVSVSVSASTSHLSQLAEDSTHEVQKSKTSLHGSHDVLPAQQPPEEAKQLSDDEQEKPLAPSLENPQQQQRTYDNSSLDKQHSIHDHEEEKERSGNSPLTVSNTAFVTTEPATRAQLLYKKNVSEDVMAIPELLVTPQGIIDKGGETSEVLQKIPVVTDMSEQNSNAALLEHTTSNMLRISGHESVVMPPVTKESASEHSAVDEAEAASVSETANNAVEGNNAREDEQPVQESVTATAEEVNTPAKEEETLVKAVVLPRLFACEAEPPHDIPHKTLTVPPLAAIAEEETVNNAVMSEQNVTSTTTPTALDLDRGFVLVHLQGLAELARRLYAEGDDVADAMDASDTLSSSQALRALYDVTQTQPAASQTASITAPKDLLLRAVLYRGSGEVVACGSSFCLRDYASRHSNADMHTLLGWSDVLVLSNIETGEEPGEAMQSASLLLRVECVDVDTLDKTAVRSTPVKEQEAVVTHSDTLTSSTNTLAISATALPMSALMQQVKANMNNNTKQASPSNPWLPANFSVTLLATDYAVAQLRAACTSFISTNATDSIYEGMPLLTCQVIAGACEKYCVQARLRPGLVTLSEFIRALHDEQKIIGKNDTLDLTQSASARRELVEGDDYEEEDLSHAIPSNTFIQRLHCPESTVTTVWGSIPVSLRAPLLRRMAPQHTTQALPEDNSDSSRSSKAMQPSAGTSMPDSALNPSLQVSQQHGSSNGNNSASKALVLPHRMRCSLVLHCGVAVLDELPGLPDLSNFPLVQLSATGGTGSMLLMGDTKPIDNLPMYNPAWTSYALSSQCVNQRAPVMRYDYTLQTTLSLAQHPFVLLTLHHSSAPSTIMSCEADMCELTIAQACFAPFQLLPTSAPLTQGNNVSYKGSLLQCRRVGDVWLPLYAQRPPNTSPCEQSYDSVESKSTTQKVRVGWMHCRYDCLYDDTTNDDNESSEKALVREELLRVQDPLEGWADLCVVRAAGLPVKRAGLRCNAFCEVEAYLLPQSKAENVNKEEEEEGSNSGQAKSGNILNTTTTPNTSNAQAIPCCVTPIVMQDNYPCWRHTFRLYLRELAAFSLLLRDSVDCSPEQTQTTLLPSSPTLGTSVRHVGSVTLSRHALHALLTLNMGAHYTDGECAVRGAWLPLTRPYTTHRLSQQHNTWAGAVYVTCRPLSTSSTLRLRRSRSLLISPYTGKDEDGVVWSCAARPLTTGIVSCYAGNTQSGTHRHPLTISWIHIRPSHVMQWAWLRHLLYSWNTYNRRGGVIEMAVCDGESGSVVPIYRVRRAHKSKRLQHKGGKPNRSDTNKVHSDVCEDFNSVWLPCEPHQTLQFVLYYLPSEGTLAEQGIRLAWATLAPTHWADTVHYFEQRDYTFAWRPCHTLWGQHDIQGNTLHTPEVTQELGDDKNNEATREEGEQAVAVAPLKTSSTQCVLPLWSRLPHYVEPDGLCALCLTRLPMFDVLTSTTRHNIAKAEATPQVWQWPCVTNAEDENAIDELGKKDSVAGLDMELMEYILFTTPQDEAVTQKGLSRHESGMRLTVVEEVKDKEQLVEVEGLHSLKSGVEEFNSKNDGVLPASPTDLTTKQQAHTIVSLRWRCPRLVTHSTPPLPPVFTLRCYVPHNTNIEKRRNTLSGTCCVGVTAPMSLNAFDHTSGELWLALYETPCAYDDDETLSDVKRTHVGFIRVAYVHNFVPYITDADKEEDALQHESNTDIETEDEEEDALVAVHLDRLTLRSEISNRQVDSMKVLLGLAKRTQCVTLQRAEQTDAEDKTNAVYCSTADRIALLPCSTNALQQKKIEDVHRRKLRVQVLLLSTEDKTATSCFALVPLTLTYSASSRTVTDNHELCGQSLCVPLFTLCKEDTPSKGPGCAQRVVGEVRLQYCLLTSKGRQNDRVTREMTSLRRGGPLRVVYVTLPSGHATKRTTLVKEREALLDLNTLREHGVRGTVDVNHEVPFAQQALARIMQRSALPVAPAVHYMVISQIRWHVLPTTALTGEANVRVAIRTAVSLGKEDKAAQTIYADYTTLTNTNSSKGDSTADTKKEDMIITSWPAEQRLIVPLCDVSIGTNNSSDITLDVVVTMEQANTVPVAVGQLYLCLPMFDVEHRIVPLTWSTRDAKKKNDTLLGSAAGMLECCCAVSTFSKAHASLRAIGTKDEQDKARDEVVLARIAITQLTLGDVQLAALSHSQRALLCCTVQPAAVTTDHIPMSFSHDEQHMASCVALIKEKGWSGTLCLHRPIPQLNVTLDIPTALVHPRGGMHRRVNTNKKEDGLGVQAVATIVLPDDVFLTPLSTSEQPNSHTCEAQVNIQDNAQWLYISPGHVTVTVTRLASLREGYSTCHLFLQPKLELHVLDCLGLVQGDVHVVQKLQRLYSVMQRKALRQLRRRGCVRQDLQQQLCQLRTILLGGQKVNNTSQEGETEKVHEPMLQIEVVEQQPTHKAQEGDVKSEKEEKIRHYVSRLFAIPSALGLLTDANTSHGRQQPRNALQEQGLTSSTHHSSPLLSASVPMASTTTMTAEKALHFEVAVSAWVSQSGTSEQQKEGGEDEQLKASQVELARGVWHVQPPPLTKYSHSYPAMLHDTQSQYERQWLRLPLPVQPNTVKQVTEEEDGAKKDTGDDVKSNRACVALLLEHRWRLEVKLSTSCVFCLRLRTTRDNTPPRSQQRLLRTRRLLLRLCYGFPDGTRYIQDMALDNSDNDDEEGMSSAIVVDNKTSAKWCSAVGRIPRIGCFGARLLSIALHECLTHTNVNDGKGHLPQSENVDSSVCLAYRVWSAADEARLRSGQLFWLNFASTTTMTTTTRGDEVSNTHPGYSVLLQSVPCIDRPCHLDESKAVNDDAPSTAWVLTLSVHTIDIEGTLPQGAQGGTENTPQLVVPTQAQGATCSITLVSHTDVQQSEDIMEEDKRTHAMTAHSLCITPSVQGEAKPPTDSEQHDAQDNTVNGVKTHWRLHWESSEGVHHSLRKSSVLTHELFANTPMLRFAVQLCADQTKSETHATTNLIATCSIADVLDKLPCTIREHNTQPTTYSCELPVYMRHASTHQCVPLPDVVLRVTTHAHIRPATSAEEATRKRISLTRKPRMKQTQITPLALSSEEAAMKEILLQDEVIYWASMAHQSQHTASSPTAATKDTTRITAAVDNATCHGILCVSIDTVTMATTAPMHNTPSSAEGSEETVKDDKSRALVLCLSDCDNASEMAAGRTLRTRLQRAGGTEPTSNTVVKDSPHIIDLVPQQKLWLGEVALGSLPVLHLTVLQEDNVSDALKGQTVNVNGADAHTACLGHTAVDLRPWWPPHEQALALMLNNTPTKQSKSRKEEKARRVSSLRALTVTMPITSDSKPPPGRKDQDATFASVTVELSVLLALSAAQVQAQDHVKAYRKLRHAKTKAAHKDEQSSNSSMSSDDASMHKTLDSQSGTLYVLSSAVATRASTPVLPGAVRCLDVVRDRAVRQSQSTLCVGGCTPTSINAVVRTNYGIHSNSHALAYFRWNDAWRLTRHTPVSRRGIFAAPLVIHPVQDIHHWPRANTASSSSYTSDGTKGNGSSSAGSTSDSNTNETARGEEQRLLYDALRDRIGHVALCLHDTTQAHCCCCLFVDGGLQRRSIASGRVNEAAQNKDYSEINELDDLSTVIAASDTTSLASLTPLLSVPETGTLPPLRPARHRRVIGKDRVTRKLLRMASPYLNSRPHIKARQREYTPNSSFHTPLQPSHATRPPLLLRELRPDRRNTSDADEDDTPPVLEHITQPYLWHAMPPCVLVPSYPQRSYIMHYDEANEEGGEYVCGYVGHCAASVQRVEDTVTGTIRHTVWLFGGWKVTKTTAAPSEGKEDANLHTEQQALRYTLCNDVRYVQLADAVDGLPATIITLKNSDKAIQADNTTEAQDAELQQPDEETKGTRWLRQKSAPALACSAVLTLNEDVYLFGGLTNKAQDEDRLEATAALWRFDTRLLRWYSYQPETEKDNVQDTWPSPRYGHSILLCDTVVDKTGREQMARYIVCGGATLENTTQNEPKLIPMQDMLWMCYLDSKHNCTWRRITIPSTAPIQPRFMPILHLSRLSSEGKDKDCEPGEQKNVVLIIAGGSSQLARHEEGSAIDRYLLNWMQATPLPSMFVECGLS